MPSIEPGGTVDVVYYESQEASTPLNPECVVSLGAPHFRVGPANSLVDTFLVQSDGGKTFSAPVQGYNRHLELVHHGYRHLPQFWGLYRGHIWSHSRSSGLGRWA